MRAARVSVTCLPLLLVLTAVADNTAAICRVEDCSNFRAIRYYEELGCARSDGSSDCCPTRFNCSSLLSVDKTKCYYKGKTYEPGAQTGDELENKCIPSCVCMTDPEVTHGGEATFICPGTDCALVGIPPEREADCYRKTTLDGCCPTEIRCVNDTDSSQNLVECPYKGKTYREDQSIEGTYSQCKRCVCQKGFDGTLDGPWCKRETCEYTIYHKVSELVKCAPIFREDENCCAYRFHCPSANDSVVRHSEPTTDNEGEQCSFGDHRLKIGDELLVDTNGCVKCRCDVPPFITCKQRAVPECEGYAILN